MIHYRVFTSDKGQFRNSEEYTFIAEFTAYDRVNDFISYFLNKECGGKKDIIIKEVEGGPVDRKEGKVGGVITSMGEGLQPEEWDFDSFC